MCNPPYGKRLGNVQDLESAKINYIIGGFLQKISIILKKVLPEKMYERLLMNHYKL